MNTRSLGHLTSCLVVLGALALSCSGSTSSGGGTGGASAPNPEGGSATGGSSVTGTGGGTGGAIPGTGGKGTGGAIPSTGGDAKGGAPGTGGRTSGTGGRASGRSGGGGGGTVPGTGGSGAGGSGRDGGPADGPTGTGGAPPPTGGTAIGGRATGGTTGGGGVTSSGGSTGAGGGTAAKPTAGCGQATFPASGSYTIDVSGTQRSYIIALPSGYDNKTPFRVIMAWHGLGGTAAGTANPGFEGSYYGVEPLARGQAIFISGQGLNNGWANTNDQDVKFIKALVEYLRKTYCLDDSRIFSIGKSYGGLFSNTLGCKMGDVFRAIAPQSSWLETANPTCVGQTAVWIDHGDTDTVISLSRGEAARDLWVKNNHCGTTTKPWDQPETTCVEYDGCDAGKPVIWCKFSGGHVMPSWASTAVWKFLQQF